jgi:hypothetical protein
MALQYELDGWHTCRVTSGGSQEILNICLQY